MITSAVAAIGWKVALIGMAAYKQRLTQRNWPYVAAQKELAKDLRHMERRDPSVAFVYHQNRRQARVY